MQINAIKWRSNGGVNGEVKLAVLLVRFYGVSELSILRRSDGGVSLSVQAELVVVLLSITGSSCLTFAWS